MVKEAERYFWAIGDRALNSVGPVMVEKCLKGVKLRFMFDESLLQLYGTALGETPNVEKEP